MLPVRHYLNIVALLFLLVTLSACTPRTQAIQEIQRTPLLMDAAFITSDASKLPLSMWLPEKLPQAVIMAVHGFNDYRNAFAYPGPYLAQHGIAVVAYDQRGFGEAPQRGIWPGIDILVHDLHEITRLIKDRFPQTPIFILGSSMGGAVALTAFSHPNAPTVDGLILVAPAAWGGDTFNGFYRLTTWLGAHTLPWLHVSGKGLKFAVTDNDEAMEALRNDPILLKESRIDALYGMIKLMDATLEQAAMVKLPILLLYGQKDEIIPKTSICTLISKLENSVTTAFYPQGYHLLLRDLQRETVFKDMLAWIVERETPLPSGYNSDCQQINPTGNSGH